MAVVTQVMTFAGISQEFDIGTFTEFAYKLTPTQEAYVQTERSLDGGATWTVIGEHIVKFEITVFKPDEQPNSRYRVRFFGGVGSLKVEMTNEP